MKVCIMCGGEGTRLRPLTFERPKPCIPIVNIPSLVHLVLHLSQQGFNDIVITLGYRSDDIINALGDGSLFGVNITYVTEEKKLGTAGSVKNAQEFLDGSPFLVVGGDHITDIDLVAFYRDHIRGDGTVSIGLVSIDNPSEYGIAEIDSDYTIRRFMEKPAPGEIFSNLASTGMYVCNPSIFDFIPEGRTFDFAKDLFPLLMEKGYLLKGWLARGHWTDVGSPEALRKAERWLLQNLGQTMINGEVVVHDASILGPVQFKSSVCIGRNARIIGPVSIGSGCTIGEGVLIGPYTSIGDGGVIGDGTKIFSSSIYNNVRIGAGTSVSGSIIDNDAEIGGGCSVENNTVIGTRAVLHDRVVVHSGSRIWPEVDVKEGTVVKEHILNSDYHPQYRGA